LNSNKSFVIYSSLTEDVGHLLLDDIFWFKNLIKADKRTIIITSEFSAKSLRQKFPENANNIYAFKEYNFLKRINYRFYLIAKLITCKKISNSNIIFQGFDEIGTILSLFKLLYRNNQLFFVPTNNVSPERFNNSSWLLSRMLKIIISYSDKFFYHTDFELKLIVEKLNLSPQQLIKNKLKYHLLAPKKVITANVDFAKKAIITFFGPTMITKPIDDICNLINSDFQLEKKFKYRFINISNNVKESIIEKLESTEFVEFNQGYLDDETYKRFISESKYVFLPHNKLFEGKLSGILSDSISMGTPIISNNIEPVIEFFKNFGPMGYIYDFQNDNNWTHSFLNDKLDEDYQYFRSNMNNCSNCHNEELIIKEFLEIIQN
jgi:hypothetical protein